MEIEELNKQLKVGMKVHIAISAPDMAEVTKMQLGANGFTIAPSEEACAVITDSALQADEYVGQEKVVVQLLLLPPAPRQRAATEESDRFTCIDMDGKGFGAFHEAIEFLRRSPHTRGEEG